MSRAPSVLYAAVSAALSWGSSALSAPRRFGRSRATRSADASSASSGLFWECARVVDELGPEWVVVENVASGAARMDRARP